MWSELVADFKRSAKFYTPFIIETLLLTLYCWSLLLILALLCGLAVLWPPALLVYLVAATVIVILLANYANYANYGKNKKENTHG